MRTDDYCVLYISVGITEVVSAVFGVEASVRDWLPQCRARAACGRHIFLNHTHLHIAVLIHKKTQNDCFSPSKRT